MSAFTLKAHFSGFSLIPSVRRQAKVSCRSSVWEAMSLLFTTMSLTYASTLRPSYLANTFVMSRVNVAPAFLRPKGMRVKQ